MVITDLAVFTIDKHGNDGMALIELTDGVTLDGEDRSQLPRGAQERLRLYCRYSADADSS
jgi:hypothetical protein